MSLTNWVKILMSASGLQLLGGLDVIRQRNFELSL